MKLCCFRFDADTHVCVSRGMPRLLDLGERLGVPFTFFVHMGRAFDPGITAAKAWGRLFRGGPRPALSAAGKLGWREAGRAVLLNPPVGRSDPAVLRAAVAAGHEIGLHGGRNHARWERDAHRWNDRELRGEVRAGQCWLEECGIREATAFASPAWNGPAGLRRVLPALGFRVLADVYDAGREDVPDLGNLRSVPTNVTAGPGRAGYLETMRLRGWGSTEVSRDFRAQLAAKTRLAVVYDHPFFTGLHALDQLGELVRTAVGEGFRVCTVSEAAARVWHPVDLPVAAHV